MNVNMQIVPKFKSLLGYHQLETTGFPHYLKVGWSYESFYETKGRKSKKYPHLLKSLL